MKAYVAILRGVNVSGKTMIKMAELKKSLEGADYEDVKTYIQSGNIVFRSAEKEARSIAADISAVIKKDFDATVPTLVVSGDYLKKVIDKNPFLDRKDIDVSKLHVTFLETAPDQAKIDAIDTQKYLPDEVYMSGDCIYLYCPNGYGITKLHNNFFESKLKVTATTRNWATVNKLSDMVHELESSNS